VPCGTWRRKWYLALPSALLSSGNVYEAKLVLVPLFWFREFHSIFMREKLNGTYFTLCITSVPFFHFWRISYGSNFYYKNTFMTALIFCDEAVGSW
jgi:hypothetical protein